MDIVWHELEYIRYAIFATMKAVNAFSHDATVFIISIHVSTAINETCIFEFLLIGLVSEHTQHLLFLP